MYFFHFLKDKNGVKLKIFNSKFNSYSFYNIHIYTSKFYRTSMVSNHSFDQFGDPCKNDHTFFWLALENSVSVCDWRFIYGLIWGSNVFFNLQIIVKIVSILKFNLCGLIHVICKLIIHYGMWCKHMSKTGV